MPDIPGMPKHLDDACDTIDACIFTGDLFYADTKALADFEVYLARWQRGIASIKDFLVMEEDQWNSL